MGSHTVSEADVDHAIAAAFGRATPQADAVDNAVAEAFGRRANVDPLTESVSRAVRGRKLQTVAEAELAVATARAFGREPDPESAATVQRLNEVRASERERFPWRAAATAGMRDQLIAAEEHLTALISRARGQAMETARATVEKRLREAWTSTTGTDHDRMTAVVVAAQKDYAHFTSVAESRPLGGHRFTTTRESTARSATKSTITEATIGGRR